MISSGTYLLSDHDGPYAIERFSCGSDEDGWRYDATREDPRTGAARGRVELRLSGTSVRLHVEAGQWVLRGAAGGGEVLWRRGPARHAVAGDGFAGTSPAHLVVTARVAARLAREHLRLVEVTEPVLATRTTEQRWRAAGESDHGGVPVARVDVDDLSTGERRVVHLSGDVVVDAPGVRLQTLTLS